MPLEDFTEELQCRLQQAQYVGSAHHKTKIGDYGFHPPTNPRPHKSLCDDLRKINLQEATALFKAGIRCGMVGAYLVKGRLGHLPKFVWAVDNTGEPYEAKLGDDGTTYHGYRLYRDRKTRKYIIREWKKRNP